MKSLTTLPNTLFASGLASRNVSRNASRNVSGALNSLLFAVLLSTGLSMSLNSHAEEKTVYISDVFYVPLHSGKSTKHRIIHRGLKSGYQLTLLKVDEKAGFSHVRTAKGTEGWIQNQFLSSTPIARILLNKSQQRQRQLEAKLTSLQTSNTTISKTSNDTQQQLKRITRKNQTLTSELASIKKISANAIVLDSNNRDLLQKNEMLKIEIAELQADNARLGDKSDKAWFVRGIMAVFMGALLSVLLPRLKPKPRSREWV